MNFVDDRIAERRLRILQAIAIDDDQSMSQSRIKMQLDAWAWKAPIEVVRQDMRYLAKVGAIRLVEAGDELIAVFRELARQHLARESFIEGVREPKQSD